MVSELKLSRNKLYFGEIKAFQCYCMCYGMESKLVCTGELAAVLAIYN
jgi:hypothetical protein